MKILVVHDRGAMLAKIVEVLASFGIVGGNVVTAEDGSEARAALQQMQFDLAIVDLTIPSVKGKSQPSYGAAEDLFTELFYGSNIYNVPGDIIGITRESDALDRISGSIGPHLMGVIQEGDDKVWEDRLRDRVSYVRKSSAARMRSLTRRYDYDVAVISALDKEIEPLKEIFQCSDIPAFSGAFEFPFTDSSGVLRKGVGLSVGAAGQAASASFVQAMIGYFRPKVFLMTGFCGGMTGKVAPGQVLFFQTVFDWDSGKWIGGVGGAEPQAAFLPRAEPLTIKDSEAVRVARRLKEGGLAEHLKVQKMAAMLSSNEISSVDFEIVTAASGSAVVGNQSVLDKIRIQNDKIVAVDMESYGFYSACKQTPYIRPEFICIKAVADFCNGEKSDRLHAACCYLSAKTVEEVIVNLWNFGEEKGSG